MAAVPLSSPEARTGVADEAMNAAAKITANLDDTVLLMTGASLQVSE
jgi:hypothetical protein